MALGFSANKQEPRPTRFLAYALPRAADETYRRVVKEPPLEIHDAPLGSSSSFLNYDGVLLFAGAFEEVKPGRRGTIVVCKSTPDLDQRERQLYTAIEQDKPIIFLVPAIGTRSDGYFDPTDLFRRVADHYELLIERRESEPNLESAVVDFRDYIRHYGTGYVQISPMTHRDSLVPLCKSHSGAIYGLTISRRIFILPCTTLDKREQVAAASMLAIRGVLAYRARTSTLLPTWISDFTFTKEQDLRASLEVLRAQTGVLEADLEAYSRSKGTLAWRSEPLVKAVVDQILRFFDLNLVVDDRCIEDATLRNEADETLAVFEIKGVNGNFSRENVNQLDSHRERLSLSPNTPGILIMNTFMTAASLDEKDQPPHPDIIKKAVADRVLLIRTLDLIRYADAVERGLADKQGLRTFILGESGWLKVKNSEVTIVKK